MAPSQVNLRPLSLGRTVDSGRQPSRVPPVPRGVRGSPLAPDRGRDPASTMVPVSRRSLPKALDPDITRLGRLLFREQLTLTQISDRMQYPVPTILYLIVQSRIAGLTIFAHPTIPNTTFSFLPPKEGK